jgi:hypothetical protein
MRAYEVIYTKMICLYDITDLHVITSPKKLIHVIKRTQMCPHTQSKWLSKWPYSLHTLTKRKLHNSPSTKLKNMNYPLTLCTSK